MTIMAYYGMARRRAGGYDMDSSLMDRRLCDNASNEESIQAYKRILSVLTTVSNIRASIDI